MKKLISRKGGLLAAVAALSLLGASIASAEIAQEGNIQISFHGSIAPVKLPRNELAPVGVQMGAKIKTTDGEKPPRLSEIILDINSHGVIDSKGLPLCPLGKLSNSSAARGPQGLRRRGSRPRQRDLEGRLPGPGRILDQRPAARLQRQVQGQAGDLRPRHLAREHSRSPT